MMPTFYASTKKFKLEVKRNCRNSKLIKLPNCNQYEGVLKYLMQASYTLNTGAELNHNGIP